MINYNTFNISIFQTNCYISLRDCREKSFVMERSPITLLHNVIVKLLLLIHVYRISIKANVSKICDKTNFTLLVQ